MKKIIFLLIFVTGFANAEWTKVTFSDETTMFLDAKTIKKNGDLVSVETLMNFPLGASSDDKKFSYKSSRTIEEFNCKTNQSRTIAFTWYSETMGNGKKVYSDNHSYEFNKVVPSSLFDAVKRKVCV